MAGASAPSASVSRVRTSTTRKRRGARGAGAGWGRGGGFGGTNSGRRSLGAVLASSGTIDAPVPFVSVSRTQTLRSAMTRR